MAIAGIPPLSGIPPVHFTDIIVVLSQPEQLSWGYDLSSLHSQDCASPLAGKEILSPHQGLLPAVTGSTLEAPWKHPQIPQREATLLSEVFLLRLG